MTEWWRKWHIQANLSTRGGTITNARRWDEVEAIRQNRSSDAHPSDISYKKMMMFGKGLVLMWPRVRWGDG
jgi:hypothetical protein